MRAVQEGNAGLVRGEEEEEVEEEAVEEKEEKGT